MIEDEEIRERVKSMKIGDRIDSDYHPVEVEIKVMEGEERKERERKRGKGNGEGIGTK